MEIIIQPSPAAATSVAAWIIARLLQEKHDAVLGLATGTTPLLLYRELIAMDLDWHKVTTFNLDEYVGLAAGHPQSYQSFMWENLFRHVNIAKKNIHIPDGMTKNIAKFCAQYEKQICEAGGIDLLVLGIGTDGHIGFNEPTSSLTSRTRIKTLTPQTARGNAQFFGSAAMPIAGVWGEEGPRHRGSGGRADDSDQPGFHIANASGGENFSGQRGCFPFATRGLLPLDVFQQAGPAAISASFSDHLLSKPKRRGRSA